MEGGLWTYTAVEMDHLMDEQEEWLQQGKPVSMSYEHLTIVLKTDVCTYPVTYLV